MSPSIDATGTSTSPNELYEELSGTSMASPTTAGISCVLAEFFQVKKARQPTSAELKAVLIHTTTDAGIAGPDPIFGYGSINALRAGEVINGNDGAIVQLEDVAESASKTFTLQATGKPIRATIVWTDPPAPSNTGGLDHPTKTLQNDLDLTLQSPDGSNFFPYRLAPANPLSPAPTNGPNTVDNVEVIDVATAPGNWTVTVKGTNFAQGDNQKFALVVSGLKTP